MSLGLQGAGFDVVLGVDRNTHAIETHSAFFGGVSLCADLSNPDVVEEVAGKLKGIPIALVAGGPPCQPFSSAGRSKIRSLVNSGDWISDGRRELWRSFVRFVEIVTPQAVLVENVPEMALGHDAVVLRKLVIALEQNGYTVHARIIPAWQYGVPQHRKRLILVGVRGKVHYRWPEALIENNNRVTVRDAISDLPLIEGGEGDLEMHYAGPMTQFQHTSRAAVPAPHTAKVFDHYARPVRDDDLEAFRLMDHRTYYSDLPESLRRYRSDIFKDKYKRLSWDDLSRTITAHLARDGYWYIHPEQHRSLTVREAARLQTFPDWYRFSGSPTSGFRQIGEAVPPKLAESLGRSLLLALQARTRVRYTFSSLVISETLCTWIEDLECKEMSAPWRKGESVWQVLLGMILFEKVQIKTRRVFWPTYLNRWPTAEAFLSDAVRHVALRALGAVTAAVVLEEVAEWCKSNQPDEQLLERGLAGISKERLAVAHALVGNVDWRPIPSPAVRVAERVAGESADNSRATAQLMVARVVGLDPNGRSYAGLLEIADQFCTPVAPRCRACPLRPNCLTGIARSKSKETGSLDLAST